MKELKDGLWGSVHPDTPMHVLRFKDFESFGKIPRSSDRQTVPLSKVPGSKLVFISHRWLRPWHTKEECEKNGHEWAGCDPFLCIHLSCAASAASACPASLTHQSTSSFASS